MAKHRYVRFWSKRSIVSLIGIDYKVLEASEHDNFLKFFAAGFLVLGILGVSFFGVFYAFELMFEMWHAELLLSSFFSLMFFTIYIFLIQTFSKEVFPTPYKIKFFNLSNLSRTGFVLMIGFLIAQPIKIFLLRHQLDNDIAVYRVNLYEQFCEANKVLYNNDINKLNADISRYQLLPKSITVAAEIAKIKGQLNQIDQKINQQNKNAWASIAKSNFFIKRITIAAKYPLGKLIVILVLTLFFVPIVLIYSISGTSRYYKLKKLKDRKMVDEAYAIFKLKYSQLFLHNYQLPNVQYHENFEDPPFNTIRKNGPDYFSQDEFFKKFFADERF